MLIFSRFIAIYTNFSRSCLNNRFLSMLKFLQRKQRYNFVLWHKCETVKKNLNLVFAPFHYKSETTNPRTRRATPTSFLKKYSSTYMMKIIPRLNNVKKKLLRKSVDNCTSCTRIGRLFCRLYNFCLLSHSMELILLPGIIFIFTYPLFLYNKALSCEMMYRGKNT